MCNCHLYNSPAAESTTSCENQERYNDDAWKVMPPTMIRDSMGVMLMLTMVGGVRDAGYDFGGDGWCGFWWW